MDTRPLPSEYGAYYETYIALAPEPDALVTLQSQLDDFRDVVRAIPAERETYRYAPGKWSIRELFDHLIDAERVFGYRAFCIGRGDRTPLPSFDENAYAAASRAHSIPLATLLDELLLVRRGNLLALRRFDAAELKHVGVASAKPCSTRALATMMVGHARHHLAILGERYGVPGVR